MPRDLLTPPDPDEFASHFIGTVVRSFWSNPATESGGKASYDGAYDTKLFWEVRIDEILQQNAIVTGDTQTVQFSMGKGYDITTDVDVVRHENDRSDNDPNAVPIVPKTSQKSPGSELAQLFGVISGKLIHYGSNGGKAAWASDADDFDTSLSYDMGGASEYLRANGLTDPRVASIWDGTTWEFRSVVKDWGMKDQTTGEKIEPRGKTLPVAFKGANGAGGGGSGGGGAPKSLEDITTTVGSLLPTDNSKLVEDVAKLVATSSTHSSFARQALSLVGEDEGLKAAVMDEVNGPWGAK